jgi:hypothetical protein
MLGEDRIAGSHAALGSEAARQEAPTPIFVLDDNRCAWTYDLPQDAFDLSDVRRPNANSSSGFVLVNADD